MKIIPRLPQTQLDKLPKTNTSKLNNLSVWKSLKIMPKRSRTSTLKRCKGSRGRTLLNLTYKVKLLHLDQLISIQIYKLRFLNRAWNQKVSNREYQHSKKHSLHNFTNRLQKPSENEKSPLGAKPPGQKTSRNLSQERDFCEISSILIQNNDVSADHSVHDYIPVDHNEIKRNSLAEARARKDSTKSHDFQSIGSRNFHLNIMYLMKEDQDNKSLTKDVGSINQIKNEQGEINKDSPYSSESKNNSYPSEKDNYMSNQDYLPLKKAESEASRYTSAAKSTTNTNNLMKDNSPQLLSAPDPVQQSVLYSINLRNNGPSKPISKFDSNVKSQEFDFEGSVPSHGQTLVQVRHMRSTSLHQEEFCNAKKSISNLEESSSHQKTQEADIVKKNGNDIRTLDAARDLIRTFRVRLSSFAYVVDNNLLDENYTREIIALIKDHNDNKYLLSNKDAELLTKLENAISSTHRDSVKSNDIDHGHDQKGSRSVSANMKGPKYISTSIKDLENMQEISKLQGLKKQCEPDMINDSASSGQGSNQDDRSINLRLNLGATKEPNLLYSKSNSKYTGENIATGYYSSERASAGTYRIEKSPINYTSNSNTVNIYNQFSGQDMKSVQYIDSIDAFIYSSRPTRELYTAPKTFTEDNSYGFRKVSGLPDISDAVSSRGKASVDVQNLIEKQKRNLEEFDKIKKENTIKNVIKGVIDIYNSGKGPQTDLKQEWSDRDSKKSPN